MTSKTDAKTILLAGSAVVVNELAMTASEAILPGHLVERVSAGTLSKHSTAAGNATKSFAFENESDGSGIDEAYADGETVIFGTCPAGTKINAILADSNTIAIGDFLESNGDGTLRALAADAATDQDQRTSVIGQALEAVTTSGATARIEIEVA